MSDLTDAHKSKGAFPKEQQFSILMRVILKWNAQSAHMDVVLDLLNLISQSQFLEGFLRTYKAKYYSPDFKKTVKLAHY